MSASLSAIFSMQDKMSAKLAGISKEGKAVSGLMNDIGLAVDRAFKTKSVDEFEKKTEKSIGSVEKAINSSSKTMEKSMDDSFGGMQNSVKKLDKDLDKLGRDTLPDAGREIDDLGDESNDTGKAVERLDNKTSGLGGTLRTLAGIVGTVFAVNKVKDFAEDTLDSFVTFESSMQEVFTMLPGITADGMEEMQQQVKDFGKPMGTLTTETVPALYSALSAGVPQDNVFSFLETANKAAIGGISTIETAVDGLSSVTNAYGSDVIDAGRASDLMFTTVRLGKTTFEELAGSLFNVVPTAVGANVAFEDISAALAAMTAQGIPTSVATTQLRQAIVELSKSGTATDETFRELAGKGFKDFIKEGGNMQDAFQILEKHAGESNLGINDLFGSVEAGNAVLALTGVGTEKFTQAMDEMKNAAGATDAAYGTMTDSVAHKMDVLAATWEDVKISAGENLGEAIAPLADDLSENIELIKEPINDMFVSIGTGITKLGSLLPKALKALSNGINTIGKVAGPIFTWIEKNPALIGTAIAGIGSAILTYKLVSTLPLLAKGIKAVGTALMANPWALVATAVVGAIVTIATTIKNKEKELKKANLDEHFGSISLSLEDLEDVAAHIIKSDVLGKLGTSLDSLEAAERLSESMEEAVKEINKLNWKVGIGMELTEDEKQSYMSSIENFIKDAENSLVEQQYAMSINMQIFTDDGSEGDAIEAAMNGFFARNQEKVALLGSELQEVVNKSFEDGLLDVDEAKVIADYMQQISELTDAISKAEFEASLTRISIDYSGVALTDETFMDLQNELDAQVKERITGIQNAFDSTLAYYEMAYNSGDMNEDLYRTAKEQATSNYLSLIGEAELDSLNYQLETILKAYDKELGSAIPEYKKQIEDRLSYWFGDVFEYEWQEESGIMLYNLYAENGNELFEASQLDKTTRKAVEELFKNMEPLIQDMDTLKNKYKEYGIAIPEALSKGLTDTAVLGGLVRDTDSVAQLISESIASSDAYSKMIEDARALGANIPAELIKAIEDNTPAKTSISLKIKYDLMHETDRLGLFDKYMLPAIDPEWRIPMNMPGHADGGIFDTPHLAWFAEEGPEAAIPLDGSDRAIDLWETSGRLMGLYDEPLEVPDRSYNKSEGYGNYDSSKTVNINLNGNGIIQIDGNMSKKDAATAIYDKLELREAIIEIMEDEIFEGGDGYYEF